MKKEGESITMHTRSFPAKAGNDGYAGTLAATKKKKKSPMRVGEQNLKIVSRIGK
jgi:hypothetical protein